MQNISHSIGKRGGPILPVYLNQRVVFDLVAMLQGGISTVTRVSEVHKEATAGSDEIGGTFGLSKALSSLLRIDLSGKTTESVESEKGRALSEERVHTPASLFYTVSGLMVQRKVLLEDSETMKPEPGDYIQFCAELKKNPVLDALESLSEMVGLASAFQPSQVSRRDQKNSQADEIGKIRLQFKSLAESLRAGNTTDLTTGSLKCSFRAVLTVETQYLNDPAMSDLVDGTFEVIGKVIRVVREGPTGVDLLRKTTLGKFPRQLLEQGFKPLSELSSQQNFGLSTIQWEIPPPVIQVLPIAIFA